MAGKARFSDSKKHKNSGIECVALVLIELRLPCAGCQPCACVTCAGTRVLHALISNPPCPTSTPPFLSSNPPFITSIWQRNEVRARRGLATLCQNTVPKHSDNCCFALRARRDLNNHTFRSTLRILAFRCGQGAVERKYVSCCSFGSFRFVGLFACGQGAVLMFGPSCCAMV